MQAWCMNITFYHWQNTSNFISCCRLTDENKKLIHLVTALDQQVKLKYSLLYIYKVYVLHIQYLPVLVK